MAQEKRKAVMKIPVRVDRHDTSEPNGKDDNYVITLKALDGLFYVGMREAEAVLKVKAKDDIIKHNFPLGTEFVVEIYRREWSEAEPKQTTEPTTLDENLLKDIEEEAVEESSEVSE